MAENMNKLQEVETSVVGFLTIPLKLKYRTGFPKTGGKIRPRTGNSQGGNKIRSNKKCRRRAI